MWLNVREFPVDLGRGLRERFSRDDEPEEDDGVEMDDGVNEIDGLLSELRDDEDEDDEEDDDYCTLWLKRCDRWRVDGEDCMGVPWGERAQRDFPPAKLRERPAWQKAILDLDKPADCGDAESARRFLARCARRRDAAPSEPPTMPVVVEESTAAQTVLDHVVDHGELPDEVVDYRPLVTVIQGLDEENTRIQDQIKDIKSSIQTLEDDISR